MKLFTVQKKGILDYIEENDVYYPDIHKSSFVAENPELLNLYSFVLDSFNHINNCNFGGLIFGFADDTISAVRCFDDFQSFKRAIMFKAPGKIDALWKKMLAPDSVILELEYDDFNPLFIDINDFQALMPPVIPLPPYSGEVFQMIMDSLSRGECSYSVMPSRLLQAHAPFISSENIQGVYKVFDIDESPYRDKDLKIFETKRILRSLSESDQSTLYNAINGELNMLDKMRIQSAAESDDVEIMFNTMAEVFVDHGVDLASMLQ